MIFKKKMRTCFKCDQEFPDSYEACPICYPSEFELSVGNVVAIVGVIFLILLILVNL
jgi:RNA polymerase subunit RPABC4/transcription elongation factor Spt4